MQAGGLAPSLDGLVFADWKPPWPIQQGKLRGNAAGAGPPSCMLVMVQAKPVWQDMLGSGVLDTARVACLLDYTMVMRSIS